MRSILRLHYPGFANPPRLHIAGIRRLSHGIEVPTRRNQIRVVQFESPLDDLSAAAIGRHGPNTCRIMTYAPASTVSNWLYQVLRMVRQPVPHGSTHLKDASTVPAVSICKASPCPHSTGPLD